MADVREILSEVYRRTLRQGPSGRQAVSTVRTLRDHAVIRDNDEAHTSAPPTAADELLVWLPFDPRSRLENQFEEWADGGQTDAPSSGGLAAEDAALYGGVLGQGSASIRYTTSDFTTLGETWSVEFWLRISGTPPTAPSVFSGGTGLDAVTIGTTDAGAVTVRRGVATGATPNGVLAALSGDATLDDEGFKHIVVTYDNGTFLVYVNGVRHTAS